MSNAEKSQPAVFGGSKIGIRAAGPDPVWDRYEEWPMGHAHGPLADPPEFIVTTDLKELHRCGAVLVVAACMWQGPPDAEFWHDTDTLRVGARTKDGVRWEYVEGSWRREERTQLEVVVP